MPGNDKLAEVNATLDRFAKLIEANAQQLIKDKEEAKRQRAEDEAKWARQRAEDKAKDEKRQAEWARQRAEDKAKDEEREARWEKRVTGINSRLGGQGNSIGEITEAMTISDNIIDLLNEFSGIDLEYFSFNITKKYPAKTPEGIAIRKQHEVDGLADGKESVVVIEAKTVLTRERIQRFLDKLASFKLAYPDHADKDLYGAMTFIRVDNDACQLAERHGLFLIKASPPDVELINNKGFRPAKIS